MWGVCISRCRASCQACCTNWLHGQVDLCMLAAGTITADQAAAMATLVAGKVILILIECGAAY